MFTYSRIIPQFAPMVHAWMIRMFPGVQVTARAGVFLNKMGKCEDCARDS